MNDARNGDARNRHARPELLEAARAAGARDPHALLDDARTALGADALAERILAATRAERAAAHARTIWRRVAALILLGGAAALAAHFAARSRAPAASSPPAPESSADCVRLDREQLESALPLFARAGADADQSSLPRSLLGELLVARSAGVAAHAFPEWLNDSQRLPEAGPLERALWAELLCDRYVLLGQHPLLLEELLGRATEPAVAQLHEHALARADRLGLRAGERLGDVACTPLSQAWLKQLAGQAAVQRDAEARRWVASALQP